MPRRTPGSDNRVLLVCRLLNRRRARYLITGGVAANLHGSVRATKDVACPLASVVSLMRSKSRPFTIVGDMPRVDLLTVACTVTFEKAWPNRMVRRINGIRVKYLGRADLIRSKRTGRASDRADIEVLLRLKGAP